MLKEKVDAMSIWLVTQTAEPHAFLNELKTRSLRKGAHGSRASASRHVYATEWCPLTVDVAMHTAVVILHKGTPLAERRRSLEEGVDRCRPLPESVTVSVSVPSSSSHLPLAALELAVALAQAQVENATRCRIWLFTTGTQGIDAPTCAHAGVWGLSRSVRTEASLMLGCIDATTAAPRTQGIAANEYEAAHHLNACLVPRLVHALHVSTAYVQEKAAPHSHLVTGGTSGLGLLTARWLSHSKPTALVLASRGGAVARDAAGEWARATEAATLVQRCDTTQATQLRQLASLAPLWRGCTSVWHAAGVLADSLLPKQNSISLCLVHSPKALAAGLLHDAFAQAVLGTCVLFSSIATLFGGSAQANYSASNACLDALASCCRARSRACASIQWGAWAELGMAARGAASQRMAAKEAASGFSRIGLAQGLGALQLVASSNVPSIVAVVPVQWHQAMDGQDAPALLSRMSTAREKPRCTASTRSVGDAAPLVTLDAVLDMVRQTAGSASVDADAPLMEQGVDSLGAVELRNQLQKAAGETAVLSSTVVFDHPTVRSLHRSMHVDTKLAEVVLADFDAIDTAFVSISSLVTMMPGHYGLQASTWRLTATKHDAICTAPLSRWDDKSDVHNGPVRYGAFLQAPALFDNAFFSISPVETSSMDPQQRMLLEAGCVRAYWMFMVCHADCI